MQKLKNWGMPLLAMIAVAVTGWMFDATTAATAMVLAFPAVATPRDLKTILSELKQIQDEHKGKPMPPEVGEKFEALAAEAKAIQDEADREKQIKGFEIFGREVPDPALPAGSEGKAGPISRDAEVVGYIPLGRAFVESEAFKQFVGSGMPQGGSLPFAVKSLARPGDYFLPVTRKQLAERLEGKAVATIGADVIPSQRLTEVVRTTEMDRLTIRDLVNNSRTGSASVEYVTLTPPADPAAAPTAESAVKPETTLTLGTANAPVRTIPVHMPVTEQQLQDVAQIEDTINTQLLYELALVEERQMTWGDGTGQNLLGIFNTPNVIAGRAVSGDTLLDRIRRARTDVAVAGNTPNGIAVHPYDWETIQLLKGTDNRYVWVVVTGPDGDRVWSLRVVESIAMERPDLAVNTNTIHERRILVGDYTRGATLWDRQQAGIQVGYVNDQFIRNQRTIRAEERLAFGVQRPGAFRYIVAQAEAA